MDGVAHSVHHCVYLFFISLSLSYLFTNYKEERREKKTKKEKEKNNPEGTPKLR
jgi:hypothetical protein